MLDGRLEHPQPGVGLPRGLDRIDEADAAAEQAEVRADRRRRKVSDPLQRTARRSGVAEIVAHQPLDLLLRLGARVAERLGGLLLQLVGQHVLVASGHQVQHRADAKQIILRFLETRRLDRPTGEQRRVGQAAIVRAALRSRSAPGASFTSGSS